MSLEWRARSSSVPGRSPGRWWGLLTMVSGANIAVWFLLYRQLHEQPTAVSVARPASSSCSSSVRLCFWLRIQGRSSGADVQRICLFDTWLSSVVVGRSVATVAEICFAAQWAMILHQLGAMTERTPLERPRGDRAVDPHRGMLSCMPC